MQLRKTFLFLASAAVAAAAPAQFVPTMPMSLIQATINAAPPNTTFTFAAGTYFGTLVLGQDVVLQGAGAGICILDAQNLPSSVITVQPNLTRSTIVSGFTFRNGGNVSIGLPTEGGGIYCTFSGPIFRSCIVTGNFAGGGGFGGGGVYVEGEAPNGRSLLMEDCTITGNVADGNGGGVSVRSPLFTGTQATFVGCEIAQNSATANGGGASIVLGAEPVFDHCTIHHNQAVMLGGGVFWSEGCRPLLTACAVADNSADAGGGIHAGASGVAVIEHTSVLGNRATGASIGIGGGGGLNCEGGLANLLVRNCLFAGNSAAADGGGVRAVNAAPVFRFVTVAGNGAGGSGGGFFFDTLVGSPVVRSAIVWGNTHLAGPGSATSIAVANVQPVVQYSDVQFGTNAPWFVATDIDIDPLFATGYSCKHAPNGGYFLAQDPPQPGVTNPCVDAAGGTFLHPAILGRSTRTDGRPDSGVPGATNTADMGFHYPVRTCP